MTGKHAKTAAASRRNAAPRPPERSGRPGGARQGSAAPDPKPASAPAQGRKKRGWPLIELVLFLLLVKISAGAYYIISSGPGKTPAPAPVSAAADSASPAPALNPVAEKPAPKPTSAPPAASRVDGYLAAAAEAVSPAAAQAAAPPAAVPASAVSAVSAGAFMVLGQSASAEAAAQNSAVIPLPPGGDDLLTPAAQLPTSSSAASPAAGRNDVAPLPPDAANAANPQSLRAREQELARKEAMLATKEQALSSLELELNKQLAATEASRGEMEAMLQRNEAILTEMKALRDQQKTEEELQKDARIEHLVIAYGGMKPEQAGTLVNSLDDEVAVSILSAMPGRKAGLILAFVNPDKAARLTKAISERRIDPNLLLADQPGAGQ